MDANLSSTVSCFRDFCRKSRIYESLILLGHKSNSSENRKKIINFCEFFNNPSITKARILEIIYAQTNSTGASSCSLISVLQGDVNVVKTNKSLYLR